MNQDSNVRRVSHIQSGTLERIQSPTSNNPQNATNIDLSTSQRYSQFSVSHYGLGSDNTFTNLLMYESQYVPLTPKENRNVEKKGTRIQEKSNEEQPSYYHDNTQNHNYQASDQQSEDMLFNFILKLDSGLSHRVKMAEKMAFQEIYLFSMKRFREQYQVPMELSNSESQSKPNQIDQIQLQSPFCSNHFRTSSRSNKTDCVYGLPTPQPISLPKALKKIPKVDENSMFFQENQFELNRIFRPMIRILPDILKQETIDNFGFCDSLELILYENSLSNLPQSEYDIFQLQNGNVGTSIHSGRENEVKTSFDVKNYQKFNYKKQTENQRKSFNSRPLSSYRKTQNPSNHRPISHAQTPIKNQQYQISPIKEIFNDYGHPFLMKNQSEQCQVVKPNNYQLLQKNIDSQKKINITYNNQQLPRSNSQFIRHNGLNKQYSSKNIINDPQLFPVLGRNPSGPLNQMSKPVTPSYQQPVIIHRTPLKKINSAPSSPILNKFQFTQMQEIAKRNMNLNRVKTQQLSKEQNSQNRATIKGIHHYSGNQRQSEKNSQPAENFNDYFQFTRPKKTEGEQTSHNASIKSKKSKKINVVSTKNQNLNRK